LRRRRTTTIISDGLLIPSSARSRRAASTYVCRPPSSQCRLRLPGLPPRRPSSPPSNRLQPSSLPPYNQARGREIQISIAPFTGCYRPCLAAASWGDKGRGWQREI
jgi:hypothetical protein